MTSNKFLEQLLHETYDRNHQQLKKILLIACTPRTRSNLLALELWRRGKVGCPWEYFNRSHAVSYMMQRLKTETMHDYVVSLVSKRTGSTGLFSAKFFIDDFMEFFGELRNVFHNIPFDYVYLFRRDKIQQATSWAKAMESRVWAVPDQRKSNTSVFVETGEVEKYIELINKQELAWERIFLERDISPLRIAYEDMKFPDDLLAIEKHVGVADFQFSSKNAVPRIYPQSDSSDILLKTS